MRDVRLCIDLWSSTESLPASLLQLVMESTADVSCSCPAWSCLTSVKRRSNFSSAVAILVVRVGGLFPLARRFGGGDGVDGGGLDAACGTTVISVAMV